MSLPLRSRYSMMLLSSRQAARVARPNSIRFATQQASAAGAKASSTASTTGTAQQPQAIFSEVSASTALADAAPPPPEQPKEELPQVVHSETNPDPRFYRKVPGSKLVFEPQERPKYDSSKPFYAQKLNDDDRILWTLLLSLLATIPLGYWWYGYRKAWVAEKKEKAILEYLAQHPDKQHLADKAAADAAAKAARAA